MENNPLSNRHYLWPHYFGMSEVDQINLDHDLWQMEDTWRRSLPRHTDVQWISIFPEAKKQWGPVIRKKMMEERNILEVELEELTADTLKQLQENKYPWRDELIKDHAHQKTQKIGRAIRSITHRLQFLRSIGAKKNIITSKRITDQHIQRAKEYPIEQLLEINRQGFAKCIWHEDTKPSLFCKKNFAHCFVCQKSGDTIAIVMKQQGLGFREAVLRLQ